jgi:hypothetical protein
MIVSLGKFFMTFVFNLVNVELLNTNGIPLQNQRSGTEVEEKGRRDRIYIKR